MDITSTVPNSCMFQPMDANKLTECAIGLGTDTGSGSFALAVLGGICAHDTPVFHR